MKYIIKQKIFSLGDKFNIKDEYGNDMYYVKGQVMSIGKKLRICDMQDNELCYIEQKLFRLMPEYHIYAGGELKLIVRKKFALLRNDFEIEGHEARYCINGDAWGYEFSILRGEDPVAGITRKFAAIADTYTAEIYGSEDHPMILSLAVVIDMVLHSSRK